MSAGEIFRAAAEGFKDWGLEVPGASLGRLGVGLGGIHGVVAWIYIYIYIHIIYIYIYIYRYTHTHKFHRALLQAKIAD